MSTDPDYKTGNLAMRTYVAELEERIRLLRRVIKRLDEVSQGDYKRIKELEAEREKFQEAVLFYAAGGMDAGRRMDDLGIEWREKTNNV